ncbi:hypothetical protein ACMGE7_12390 [Macrococcus equi]|uniref:hypothetical protein n=1 Tax=Macrococcus equi TaxID=3395462 RepID=UPI0039BE322A
MKEKAHFIIHTIERLANVSKGGKRAHTKGFNYQGEVQLKELGKKLLGESTEAIVRLSDALTDRKHYTRLVPLKGLAIHFKGTVPVDIVMVSFPYFPWTKADSIVKLAQYSNAIHDETDWKIKLNLMRHMLKIEQFHRHLKQFIVNQPIKTTFKDRVFYNLHYFKSNENQYIRFQAELKGNQVILFAEVHASPHSIAEIPCDYQRVEIGNIQLKSETTEQHEMFNVLEVGNNLKVLEDDEIIHLRAALYEVSNAHRLGEGMVHDDVVSLDKI